MIQTATAPDGVALIIETYFVKDGDRECAYATYHEDGERVGSQEGYGAHYTAAEARQVAWDRFLARHPGTDPNCGRASWVCPIGWQTRP